MLMNSNLIICFTVWNKCFYFLFSEPIWGLTFILSLANTVFYA